MMMMLINVNLDLIVVIHILTSCDSDAFKAWSRVKTGP